MSERMPAGGITQLPVSRSAPIKLFRPILFLLLVIGLLFYLSTETSDKPPSSDLAEAGQVDQRKVVMNRLRTQSNSELITKKEQIERSESVFTPVKSEISKAAGTNIEGEVQQSALVIDLGKTKSDEQRVIKRGIEEQAAPPLLPAVVETATDINAVAPKNQSVASYYKIGPSGEKLSDSAKVWACVEDTNTGLVWEVKSEDGGLHDKNNLYTWYEPTENGESAGIADGGRCDGGIDCDSYAYVHAINAQKLCGYSDWRLPTREEFMTLISVNGGGGSVNHDYFPQGLESWYWTATSNKKHPNYAWYLLFRNGIMLSDIKVRAKHLRLVRSESPTG